MNICKPGGLDSCCCCQSESKTNNKVCPQDQVDLGSLSQNGIPLQAADLLAIRETLGNEPFLINDLTVSSSATAAAAPSSGYAAHTLVQYNGGKLSEDTAGGIAPAAAVGGDADTVGKATAAGSGQAKDGSAPATQTIQVTVVNESTFRESLARDLNISGMKQIWGESIHCIRRFTWMVVLVISITLLCINIGSRVEYFLSYPTGLKTETMYHQRIQFPAVTICNMNQVRATGSYRMNQKESVPYRRKLITMYEAVTHFFDTLDYYDEEVVEDYLDKYWETWEECYAKDCGSDVDTSGHYKEDLIYDCKWRGRECFSDNFTAVITDMGTCYKWNGGEDGKHVHHAESAGASGGLRLVLNIEQYEYMRSQKEVAGAYGLVSDQEEASAEMAGLGFSISKGTYTSVALARILFQDLPDPHTTCQEGDPMSLCLLQCVSDYIIEQCGCKEIYMLGDAENCQVDQYLRCVYPKKRDFPSLTNYTDYCGSCLPACNRTRYDTMVSQSPISDFYAKRMAKDVLADPDVNAHFQEAQRQQDWVLLYYANDSYNTLVFNIAHHLAHVYKMTVEEPFKDLANMTRTLVQIEQSGNGDTAIYEDLKGNVTELWGIYLHLKVFTHTHYLYNYTTEESRRGEETNVRLAVDIQVGYGHTEHYAQRVNESMEGANETLYQVKTTWDLFMVESANHQHACGTTKKVTEWNDTMYECLTGLSYSIEHALDELELAMDLFTSNAETIQEDPNIKGRTLSTVELSDREFYLQNFARVDIFYEEMSYTRHRQYPSYEVAALVCDLGGNLGLYLGGSLLTVVELIDIIIISIFTCFGCVFCGRCARGRGPRVKR